MKISKLQKKMGQFASNRGNCIWRQEGSWSDRNQWLRKNNTFQADTGDIGFQMAGGLITRD